MQCNVGLRAGRVSVVDGSSEMIEFPRVAGMDMGAHCK